jgi:hypothetical protein
LHLQSQRCIAAVIGVIICYHTIIVIDIGPQARPSLGQADGRYAGALETSVTSGVGGVQSSGKQGSDAQRA